MSPLIATEYRMVCWQDNFGQAMVALSRDKVKSCLTMFGVVVGSAALVLVVALASTGKVYILSQIQGIGSNLTYAELIHNGFSSLPEDELTLDDMAAARRLPSVRAVAGTYDIPAFFRVQNKTHHAKLVGVTSDFQRIRNLHVTNGRYFDPEAFTGSDKLCMITDQLAKEAFDDGGAVGNTMVLGDFRCNIIGTFTEGVQTFGQSEIQKDTVLIPFSLVRDITGDNFLKVLYVQAGSPAEVGNVTGELKTLLHDRHRVQAQYDVQNLSAILRTAKAVSLAMTVLLILIALLTLTIAGAGIMNIMLVNVAQRTQEIGLRKAVGARPFDIRLQFLLEASFISLTGAVLGVLLAIAVVVFAATWLNHFVHPSVSWRTVVIALILCTGIGVLFGYRPASRAAELSPVDALRAE